MRKSYNINVIGYVHYSTLCDMKRMAKCHLNGLDSMNGIGGRVDIDIVFFSF